MKAIDVFSKPDNTPEGSLRPWWAARCVGRASLIHAAALLYAALIVVGSEPCLAADESVVTPPESTVATTAIAADGNTEITDNQVPAGPWIETLPERDPFWPVGYVKPELRPKQDPDELKKQAQVQAVKQKIAWPELTILSVARGGGRFIAMIGDGVGIVQAGDMAEIQRGGMVYRWDIVEITAKGVATRRKDVAPVGREDERIPYVEASDEKSVGRDL